MLGRAKLLLKYTYMASMPDYVVCRKSGIKRWELERELYRAKRIIEKRLDMPAAVCYFIPNLNRESERIRPIEPVSARLKETQHA